MQTSSCLPIHWVDEQGQQLFLKLAGKMAKPYHSLINPLHPLNQRMKNEIPGVDRHSLLISCASAIATHKLRVELGIKVDPDLARVLGLLHDVGKLTDPQFFSGAISGNRTKAKKITDENQLATLLNHPTASALICQDYPDIPTEVLLGIKQHHGTMMTYAAIAPDLAEHLKTHGGVSRLRYPGPKPQTIEAALVMIADGAEALLSSKHSREELPTPITRPFIKHVVWRVCVELWKDGQFKESGLTSAMLFRAHELIMWTYYRYYHDYDLISTPTHLRKSRKPIILP
jgi:putative nucleotidyltransferase with HDIG domain